MPEFIESLNISSSLHINALISLLLFIVFAKCADLFVDKVLRKFAHFTHSDLDDRIVDLLHKPVLFTIVALGVLSSLNYLKPSPELIVTFKGFVYSLVTLIWCITVVRLGNSFIEHGMLKVSDITGMRKDIIPLVESVFRIVVIVAGIMVVFSLWKINITPLMASAGIVGAAVAFAAKDTVANLLGGVSIFMDKPFKIGDYVVLDQGERGEVVSIGLRSTRIKTRDDVLITIPNSVIANTKIINESAPIPNFRIRIPVTVAYGSDIDLVEDTLLSLVMQNSNVIDNPSPRVRFRVFGDSALHFELLCWVKEPALRGLTIHELNSLIYKKFMALGIKIPFPQREIHLRSE